MSLFPIGRGHNLNGWIWATVPSSVQLVGITNFYGNAAARRCRGLGGVISIVVGSTEKAEAEEKEERRRLRRRKKLTGPLSVPT
jgi:hypothetical protein